MLIHRFLPTHSLLSVSSGQSIVVELSSKLGSHEYMSGAYLTSSLIYANNRAYATNAIDGESGDWVAMVPVYFLPKIAFGTFSEWFMLLPWRMEWILHRVVLES